MPSGISGLFVGTKGANDYRASCEEKCTNCPHCENGKCRIDEHEKKASE